MTNSSRRMVQAGTIFVFLPNPGGTMNRRASFDAWRASCLKRRCSDTLASPSRIRGFPGNADGYVAVSVFTHLELALQHHWAAELKRVLRPGGCLFVTVHGSSMFSKLIEEFKTHPNAGSFDVSHLGGDALFADLRFTGGMDDDPQGQREVAIAHTDSAVRCIFPGFAMAVHDEQSELAKHDVYLLVKEAVTED